jgi:hypothetical protein
MIYLFLSCFADMVARTFLSLGDDTKHIPSFQIRPKNMPDISPLRFIDRILPCQEKRSGQKIIISPFLGLPVDNSMGALHP